MLNLGTIHSSKTMAIRTITMLRLRAEAGAAGRGVP